MVYNELEQGGILSGIRLDLALLAYTDILLCSIWSFYKIRQTPGIYLCQNALCARECLLWYAIQIGMICNEAI